MEAGFSRFILSGENLVFLGVKIEGLFGTNLCFFCQNVGFFGKIWGFLVKFGFLWVKM